MATVNLTCKITYSQETGITRLTTSPLATEDTPLQLARGDTLSFSFVQVGEASGYTFQVSGFDSGYWTNTASSPVLGPGSGVLSRVSNSAAVVGAGYIDSLVINCYPGSGASVSTFLHIKITDGVDLVPNSFDLGPDINGVTPSDAMPARPFMVTGISGATSASCSSPGYFTVNGGSSVTSASVVNGAIIQVYLVASANWNSTTSTTMNIGGVTDTFSVTTANDPSSGTAIDFPITSGTIKLTDVINFFGGIQAVNPPAPRNLRGYLKGGVFVPNIPRNSLIPTAGTVALRNFLGSGTVLYFSKLPKTQSKTANTSGGGAFLEALWTVGGPFNHDFDVGYGRGMRGAVYYKYTLQEFTNSSLSTGVSLFSGTSNPGSYSQANTFISVAVSAGSNSDLRYAGEVTIHIMSVYSPSAIATCKMQYSLNFFGP